MKILIVDDSRVMRNMIKRILDKSGLEVEASEAGDGLEALEQSPEAVDMILCDWNMPNMNGLEFVRELRKREIDTPVLMVTTETHFTKQREVKDAGANGFMAKPFTAGQLAGEIQGLVPA